MDTLYKWELYAKLVLVEKKAAFQISDPRDVHNISIVLKR